MNRNLLSSSPGLMKKQRSVRFDLSPNRIYRVFPTIDENLELSIQSPCKTDRNQTKFQTDDDFNGKLSPRQGSFRQRKRDELDDSNHESKFSTNNDLDEVHHVRQELHLSHC